MKSVMIASETLPDLLKSAPHWQFEFIKDGLFFVLATLPFRAWVKRHDRKHHHGHTDTPPLAKKVPLQTQGGLNLIDRSNVGYEREGRLLPDGRVLDVVNLFLSGLLTVSATADDVGYSEAYTYATETEAVLAFCLWDGEGEPDGWICHRPSNRRRENGDPATEEIRP